MAANPELVGQFYGCLLIGLPIKVFYTLRWGWIAFFSLTTDLVPSCRPSCSPCLLLAMAERATASSELGSERGDRK